MRSVRGTPFWGAVVIAVVGTAAGGLIDKAVSSHLGAGLLVGFVLGIAVAAIAVRRGSIFTAMVQAPLVLLAVDVILTLISSTQRLTVSLITVVEVFPTMAIGTAVGLVLGLIRIFAQPLNHRATPVRRQAAA